MSKSILKKVFTASILVALSFSLLLTFYLVLFANKIYPNVFVAGVNLGSLTRDAALDKLSQQKYLEKITLKRSSEQFEIESSNIDLTYNLEETINQSFLQYRNGNILNNFKNILYSPFRKRVVNLYFSYDKSKLNEHILIITDQAIENPISPSLSVLESKITVNKGKAGEKLDKSNLLNEIHTHLSVNDPSPITIPVLSVDPSLNDKEALAYKKRADALIDKSLELIFEEEGFSHTEGNLYTYIEPSGGYKKDKSNELANSVSEKLNKNPQNPVFNFEDDKVVEFKPAQDGIQVDEDKLLGLIVEGLEVLEFTSDTTYQIEIPVEKTPPDYTTEEVNDLGIKELIGKGESKFAGSIASRIHNISLASSRFDGVLIAPGEVLSFNETVGDVSKFTGYKEAYIIKDGRTVLGDGGGVCQVSTTLFRAALNTGLPIVERRAHSYRVTYYEQGSPPGIDATVYAPITDLKIKNDTPGHILIQTIVDTKNAHLSFEIYGTNDGRDATITEPIVTNYTPPPEDLYVDDPALPIGQTKQVDWKAPGSNVEFDYLVEKDGKIIYKKTFYSNFKPWQSVFLVGTGEI